MDRETDGVRLRSNSLWVVFQRTEVDLSSRCDRVGGVYERMKMDKNERVIVVVRDGWM
jgi:hypothetical protein